MRIRRFIASSIILCVAATVVQADTIVDSGNVAREGSIKGIDERGVVLLWSLTGTEKAFAFDDIKSIKSDTINELAWAEEELADGRSAAAIRQYQKAMSKAGRTWLSEYAAARIVQAQAHDGRAVEAIKGFLQLAESGSHLAAQMGALPIADCAGKDWDEALALIDKSIAAGAGGGEGKLAHVGWLKQVKAAVVEARRQTGDSAESAGTGGGTGGSGGEGNIAERPSSDAQASVEQTGEPSSEPSGEPEVAVKEYFPLVEGRLSPVAPDEPVSDEVQQIFKEFYAEKVAKVLQSPDYGDDVALATELVEAAEKRMEFPAFAAYALDHAVYLASISNDGQLLTYEALRTQLAHKLRSSAGCLELMLSIAPRVMASQDIAKCGMWIQDRLSGDVLAWFDVQRQAGEYAKALSMSAMLQAACEKRLDGQVPESLRKSLKTIELISGYHISLQHCVAKVGEDGEFPREHLFYGIHLLTIEKKNGPAATCLIKSQNEAGVRLGECLRKTRGSGPDDYAVACAIAELAEKYEHEIAQALLWREALAWLEKALSSGGLDKIDALRANMLKERYEEQIAATGDKIPPSFAGGTTAATDDDSFFGISNSGKSTGGSSYSFFGITSKGPQSVVYVIDRSGSMTDSFMYVKQELIRSIQELTEKDRFHVIFYSSGPGLEMPARKLVPANDTNKQAAIRFIKETDPLGQTDPSDALDKAFRQKPQTIFLLTDGEFDASIPLYIDRLNSKKQTTVNTVCFMYTMGEEACKKIAEESKGVYRFVGIDEIRSKTEESRPVATRPGATQTTPSAPTPPPPPPPPPPGPPLPKAELERLERMVMVLEERQVCQACKGHPVKEVREVVPADAWGMRRIVYRKVICPTCNGTGYTPASVMRQTLREVNDMLNKYGSSVPAGVRHRAAKAMSTYK